MGKRRYSASKIARTPSLKRKLAELLADYDENKYSISKMLAYGHRGYISFDETELCKLFDKLYTKHLADAADKKHQISQNKVNPRHQWEVERQQKALEEIDKHLKRFNELADEIFEAKFLT